MSADATGLPLRSVPDRNTPIERDDRIRRHAFAHAQRKALGLGARFDRDAHRAGGDALVANDRHHRGALREPGTLGQAREHRRPLTFEVREFADQTRVVRGADMNDEAAPAARTGSRFERRDEFARDLNRLERAIKCERERPLDRIRADGFDPREQRAHVRCSDAM